MVTYFLNHPNTKTPDYNVNHCNGYSHGFSNTITIVSFLKPWVAEIVKGIFFISNLR
jgi:hypothetical protein